MITEIFYYSLTCNICNKNKTLYPDKDPKKIIYLKNKQEMLKHADFHNENLCNKCFRKTNGE